MSTIQVNRLDLPTRAEMERMTQTNLLRYGIYLKGLADAAKALAGQPGAAELKVLVDAQFELLGEVIRGWCTPVC